MYDIMVYERALYVPHSLFLVLADAWLNCVWRWSLCTVTLCTVVERWVVCYCTVSNIGGTPMMICTYHYRMDGPH